MGKSPLLSKTLWINLLAVVAMVVQSQTGFVLDMEEQMAILGVINIVLRFVTKEPVAWKPGNESGSGTIGLMATLLLLVMIVAAGCAGFFDANRGQQATQALLAAQEVVVGLAEAGDALCTQGTLDQKRCTRLAELYVRTEIVYDLAASSLQAALRAGDHPDAWSLYSANHAEFSALYSQFVAAAGEFGLIAKGGAQ